MTINFKHNINAANIDDVIEKVTNKLKSANFGILSKIDFTAKLKEKLNVDIPQTVVLGACNPKLAYEIYQKSTDFLSVLPCNVVIREIAPTKYSIEMIKPSQMVKLLANNEIDKMATSMDDDMLHLLEEIN
jgi:uncharacterized protein (DUF302 family)